MDYEQRVARWREMQEGVAKARKEAGISPERGAASDRDLCAALVKAVGEMEREGRWALSPTQWSYVQESFRIYPGVTKTDCPESPRIEWDKFYKVVFKRAEPIKREAIRAKLRARPGFRWKVTLATANDVASTIFGALAFVWGARWIHQQKNLVYDPWANKFIDFVLTSAAAAEKAWPISLAVVLALGVLCWFEQWVVARGAYGGDEYPELGEKRKWWQRISPRGVADGVGTGVHYFIEGATRLGAFGKGAGWLLLALVAFLFADSMWATSGLLTIVIGCYALYATVKGLAQWQTAFRTSPRPPSDGAHGDAGDAGPEDAEKAMAGGHSPIDSRRF
jgi:hypothetical protein